MTNFLPLPVTTEKGLHRMPCFKLNEEPRKTGIDFVGDIPWGSHFSFLYQEKEDLIDILVPYFKEGLENGEFCVWVTSNLISVREAEAALKQVVPNLDTYLQRRQIEILPYTEIYYKDGEFNQQSVLKSWDEKCDHSLTKGLDGIRVTGDTGWLEEKNKRSFMEYEAEVNRRLEGQKMIAFCTYQLSQCSSLDIIDIVNTHSHTFARGEDSWKLIGSVKFKKTATDLVKVNQHVINILDSITDAYFALDNEWRLIYINKEAKNFYKKVGFDPEGFTGKKFSELFPQAIGTRFYNEYHRAVSEMVNVHFEERSVYGNKWLEVNAYPSETGLSVFFRDITERKKSEEALRQSEERFNKAFNANPLSMAIFSPATGIIVDVNDSFVRRNRFSREELIGFKAIDLEFWVDAEELLKFTQEVKQNGRVYNFEARFRTKSGALEIALVSGVVINLNGEDCILAIANNITELRRYQNEMARLERLNLIGEMSASISHEIRNPMTTVKGFLQLLREKDKNVQEREFFDLMVSELDRANSIITEFLSLARNKAIEFKEKNLNSVVKSIAPLIEAHAMKEGKTVILDLGDIPKSLLDEKEIRQVILNLARNGLEAMHPKGCLNISTFMEGQEVILAVQDQGCGIPPDALEQIGTPFFTTKDSGTGLGLAVCYSIAERHKAKIVVETGTEGTTFYVRFNTG